MTLKLASLDEQNGSRFQMTPVQRSIGIVAFGGTADDEDDSAEAIKLTLEAEEMRTNDWKVVP